MPLLPATQDPDWLKNLASLVTLLIAVGNLGFLFGSRRRVENALSEFKEQTRERIFELKQETNTAVANLWSEARDCRDDRRDLRTMVGAVGSHR